MVDEINRKGVRILVFWEDWFSNLYPFSHLRDCRIEVPTISLLDLLDKYHFKAIFFCLGTTMKNYPDLWTQICIRGHDMRSHGYEHVSDLSQDADIKSNTWLGFTGGFWLRVLPVWLLLWNIKRKGFLYIHPYDIDENHLYTENWWFNFKRHIGLKNSRNKLEKVLENLHGFNEKNKA